MAIRDETDEIKLLHQTFIGFGGFAETFNMDHLMWWNIYRMRKYTRDDLILVMRHLQRGVRSKDRNPGCMRFKNLIKDIDNFGEELAMARSQSRANERKPVMTERTKILAAMGRNERADKDAVKAADLAPVTPEDWKKLRESLQ